jgi:hypothetical protein
MMRTSVLLACSPVQAACVLLQRAFPGNRHRQYQGVQRRMIETFADELPDGQQDEGCLGRQRVEFRNERSPLLPRHPAVQDEWRRHPPGHGGMDGAEMLGALGQHQHLAALLEDPRDFGGHGFRPGKVRVMSQEVV